MTLPKRNFVAVPTDRPRSTPRSPIGLTAGGMARDEAALLTQAGAGNESAFRALAERHMQPVYLTARRLLRNEADAEDAAQEAFLRLWRSAGSLEIGPSGVLPWLRRVTSNIAIDRLRASRRLEVTDEVPEQEIKPTQLSELVAQDAAARVDAALRTLPDRQRAALTLFHYQGMSQREVAECLDVSEEALESLLARARRKMKSLLAEEWRDLLSGTGQA